MLIEAFLFGENMNYNKINSLNKSFVETELLNLIVELESTSGGGGGGSAFPGGTTGQLLGKLSNTNGDFTWYTIRSLPSPGTNGQILTIVAGTPQYQDNPAKSYRQILSIGRRLR